MAVNDTLRCETDLSLGQFEPFRLSSSRTREKTGGRKNHRIALRYHSTQTLQISTYNIKTFSTQAKLLEHEDELKYIK